MIDEWMDRGRGRGRRKRKKRRREDGRREEIEENDGRSSCMRA